MSDTNKSEDQEALTDEMKSFIFDIRQKKIEILTMFEDVMGICKSLVAKAKIDPTKVQATMMAQILRLMSQSSGIIKMAEALREEIDEAIEREEDEDEMTEEEREMLRVFNESCGDLDIEPIYDEDSKSKSFHQEFNKSF